MTCIQNWAGFQPTLEHCYLALIAEVGTEPLRCILYVKSQFCDLHCDVSFAID